jgi:inorganic pyrophosphatase
VKANFLSQLPAVEDIEKFKPGALHSIREFYTNYKVPDGKPKNEFAFGGEVKDAVRLFFFLFTHTSWCARAKRSNI